jgi:hypothetical protein
MRRFWGICCALVFCLGCTSDGSDNGQWNEFWKDLRGDNMKMRYDFTGKKKTEDPPQANWDD